MRKLLVLSLIFSAMTLTANAATISYTDSITGLLDMTETRDLVVSQFDPSLGTLNSITLNAIASIDASFGIENLIRYARTLNLSNSYMMGYVYITGLVGASFNENQPYYLSLGVFDGTVDYAGTSGTIVDTFGDSQTAAYNIGPDPSFIGTGNMTFAVQADAMAMVQTLSNFAAIFNTTGDASVTVTYDYTAVPEPTTMAILAIMGLVLKCKKR